MIRKILVSCHFWETASNVKEVIEVEIDDDATPEEIADAKAEAAREWAWEQISHSWSDATDDDPL